MTSFQARGHRGAGLRDVRPDLITALNNVTIPEQEWFYGEHGHAVHRFYASQPLPLPHPLYGVE
jgi:hypothetical protein